MIVRQEPEGDLQAFARYEQNTHSVEVTVSIGASVKRLLERYGYQFDTRKLLGQIKQYIQQNKSYSSQQKNTVIHCLERIKGIESTQMGIDLTLSQILALVWWGCNDERAVVEGQEAPLAPEDLESRRRHLIANLIAAQTTYGPNKPSCFTGTLNKIVESLDRTHPDVTIITGKTGVLPVATERSRIIVRDALSRITAKEKKAILRTWNDEDEKSEAASFRGGMVPIVDLQLKEEFQTLLTCVQREEITGAFDYLPRPVMHQPLHGLVMAIQSMPDDNGCVARQAAIEQIRAHAQHAYDDSDRSLEDAYWALLGHYLALKLHALKLHMWRECLVDLRGQSVQLEQLGYEDAAACATGLAEALENTTREFIDSQIKCDVFTARCSEAIEAARPVLETHRSWQYILGNLVLAVLGLGVFYVVACCIHKINTGYFLFFNETRAVQRLDDLNDALSRVERTTFKP